MLVVHPGRAEHADGPDGDALGLVRGHDERALGQRLDAGVLRADRDRLALGEHVAQQRHDDVGLLEDAEDGPHLVDGIEALGHVRRAADEHLVVGPAVASPSLEGVHARLEPASSTVAVAARRLGRTRPSELPERRCCRSGARRSKDGVGDVLADA